MHCPVQRVRGRAFLEFFPFFFFSTRFIDPRGSRKVFPSKGGNDRGKGMEKRRRQVRKVTCRKTFPPSIGARRNRALEKARVEIGGEKGKRRWGRISSV